jgi:hypothetical protein
MTRKAASVLCGSSCGGDRRELDHQVRLGDELAQQLARCVGLGHEALEDLLRGEQHLVGGLASAALAAHAVGHDAQQAGRDPGMPQDGDLILLVRPITLVGCPWRPRA